MTEKDNVNPYHNLIQSVQLVQVRIAEASYHSVVQIPPKECSIEVKTDTKIKSSSDGFVALQTLCVSFSSNEVILGEVTCVFELLYTCDCDTESEEFKTAIEEFAQGSVPFNAWAYLREFVGNALSRMGWPPFALPLLKQRVVVGNNSITATGELPSEGEQPQDNS